MSLVWTGSGAKGVPRAARYTTGSAPSALLYTSKRAPGVSAAATWNGAAGVAVATPMLLPVWNTFESPRSVVEVNTARRPAVPVAVSGVMAAVPVLSVRPPPVASSARTNADTGLPPTVSASAAFRAYGTATSIARGRSRPATDTCSQRAVSLRNSSSGTAAPAPRYAAYRPRSSAVTVCVSLHRSGPPSASPNNANVTVCDPVSGAPAASVKIPDTGMRRVVGAGVIS